MRRSAGMVRKPGRVAELVEGDTKSGKPRVIDLDPETVAVLPRLAKSAARGARSWPATSARFGDIEGQHRNPEHVCRQFARDAAAGAAARRCR